MNSISNLVYAVLVAVTFGATAEAGADVDGSNPTGPYPVAAYGFSEPVDRQNETVQRGCMSLSEAVESIRGRGNVERVISAETKVRNGREVHVIKVLTRDGKVRTHEVPGCGRG